MMPETTATRHATRLRGTAKILRLADRHIAAKACTEAADELDSLTAERDRLIRMVEDNRYQAPARERCDPPTSFGALAFHLFKLKSLIREKQDKGGAVERGPDGA